MSAAAAVLIASASLVVLALAIAASLLWLRYRERERNRRTRAFTVRLGKVELFEQRIPAPPGAADGDEWGECVLGRWIVRRWDGEAARWVELRRANA